MIPCDPIGQAFEPVFGMPCWDVKPGVGTFLTLEFGPPTLFIIEPRPVPPDATPKFRRNAARRIVYVRGTWGLWIQHCAWEVQSRGESVGDWATEEGSRAAAEELDGQQLVGFDLDPEKVRTTFTFDLGGALVTWPMPEPYGKGPLVHWFLREPTGGWLTIREDGLFRRAAGSQESSPADWRPLPGRRAQPAD